MLVKTRIETVRTRAFIWVHRKNCITKFSFGERSSNSLIIRSKNRLINNINNRRRNLAKLLKNINKIVLCYIAKTLLISNIISSIINKRSNTVYLITSRGGCMKKNCVTVTVPIPMGLCTLPPISIILS